MTSSIHDRLVACFQDVFPEWTVARIESADHAAEEDWDSLASLTLVSVVEEEFDIVLDDELVAELTSFGHIETALSSRPEQS